MNDLLQLKKQPRHLKIEPDEQMTSVRVITQTELQQKHLQKPQHHQMQSESIVKSREVKPNLNHKRPSLSSEINGSKRAKGVDTCLDTTSQQMITSSNNNQKSRLKVQVQQSERWSPLATPQKAQQSSSVLMNLLVSGCDVSAGYYTCQPRPKVAKA